MTVSKGNPSALSQSPLSLSPSRHHHPHHTALVTRIVSGGQAEKAGVCVGDFVVGVGNQWVEGYEDFLKCLEGVKDYPLSIVLRRMTR
jgi:hypothetical protein